MEAEKELELTVDTSYTRKVKDIAAGFVGGAAQVLIGQPADLVKVRLQTQARNDVGSLGIIRQVLRNEGALAFYKGTIPPLFGVGVCVSLQFYGFHEARRQILARTGSSSLNIWPQTYLAGAAAGLINSPIASPVEQLRILSQANTAGPIPLRKMIQSIYSQYGLRGMYRGFGITAVREFHSYGVWFATYELSIQKLMSLQNFKSKADIPTVQLLGSGAAAGVMLWLSSYPLDVVKSTVQSDKLGKSSRFNGSSLAAAKSIYRLHGWKGFWRGLTPCLLRAVPCSAGTFASVELALRIMG